MTVRCAGGKQSVSPALKPCVSAVVVAGSIAPAFCCCSCSCCCSRYCTLRLQSTHHNINCVIRLQCLPRDGDRPPATGPCRRTTPTRLPSTFLLSFSVRAEKTSQSTHHKHCLLMSFHIKAPGKHFVRSLKAQDSNAL